MYIEEVKTVLTLNGENIVARDPNVKFPNTLAEAVELEGGEHKVLNLLVQIRRTKEQQRLRKLVLAQEAPKVAPREATARVIDLSQPPPTAQPKITRSRSRSAGGPQAATA